ncbi:hypothetical protein [Ligilactobacillus saerimneri]|uniref:hypothetical protein n=1 Tax=Ligilactobacillus saerimneri TaxID=228229 RepID=UPI002430EAA1|nr:hypothetical protein [Ligilactobacillus saerimneri]
MLKVRYRRTKAYTMVTCLLLLGILGMVAVGQSLCYYARIMSYQEMINTNQAQTVMNRLRYDQCHAGTYSEGKVVWQGGHYVVTLSNNQQYCFEK